MRIDRKYSKLEKVTYSFTRHELRKALIEYAKRLHNIPDGGDWSIDLFHDYELDELCIDLIQEFKHKVLANGA